MGPGFWKFILLSIGMLVATGLAFDLLRVIWRYIFDVPISGVVILILLIFSFLICIASGSYRWVFEGHDIGKRPIHYDQTKWKLERLAFPAFFFALVLMWYQYSQWVGWAWVFVYVASELRIRSLADRRLFDIRLSQARNWFPNMTPEQQKARATLWFDSCMTPVEYELKHGNTPE